MIITIKESGFCHGVQSAISKANANFANIENGQKVYLFGDLANNSRIMSKYHAKGFLVTDNTNDIQPGSKVIIRAHGVPKAVCQSLESKCVTIEDCTCVKVKNIHRIVERESEKGSTIVIIGKKDHPEVIGTCGWCKNPVVLETEADLECIDPNSPICVVGQTTCKRDWWNKACALVLQKCPDANIYNTLCSVLTDKLEKAADIARTTQAMIIVGDKKSANSVELYNTCSKICSNTIFVSCLDELLAMKIKDLYTWTNIGLIGSASTPAELVEEIHGYLAFTMFLAESKKEIENYSSCKMESNIAKSTGKPFIPEAVQDLYEQNRGGKCIRGAMIRLGEKIASDISNYFLPVASAYELFQTAILIHDDIIDRSETRRSKKTIHTKSCQDQLTKGNKDAMHFGISRALCVGDYGLFLANNMLAHAPLCDTTKVRLFQQFSEIQLHTLEGEIMDVTLPVEQINIDENYSGYMEAVTEIYQSKTAWYTLAGPLIMGAICGGAQEKLTNQLRDIALPLGIAFQIKDDLLGMYASDEVLGKPAISDLEEQKQTLIYGYAYKHGTNQQKAKLNELYGKLGATLEDLKIVRDIFTETGAKKFAEDKIAELSQCSLQLIDNSQFGHQYKLLLQGLVSYLTVREF